MAVWLRTKNENRQPPTSASVDEVKIAKRKLSGREKCSCFVSSRQEFQIDAMRFKLLMQVNSSARFRMPSSA